MKKIICQYAIVRFAPFIETGEFANVGVFMMAAKERFFGFKLETRRYGRITRFFDELEPRLFREAMRQAQDEFGRVHQHLKDHGFDRRRRVNDLDYAGRIFAELVRPRENILRTSEPRLVLTDDPSKKLKDLFAFYVERRNTKKPKVREEGCV